MKKVTAFIGTARKKQTYYAVQRFLGSLASQGDRAAGALFDYSAARSAGR